MALAELREAEAPPETAAIYAALRAASGVPQVNLIYRHLATLDGVLPWVWAAIRPPLLDGRLAAARAAGGGRAAAAAGADSGRGLGGGRARPGRPRRRRRAGRGLQPRQPDQPHPADRAPPGAGGRRAARAAARAGGRAARDAAAAAAAAAARLLAPESAALVQGLAARHPGGVVPSLYLHLAHWPGLLAALPGWAGSLVEPTAVAAGRDAMLAPATAEAAALRLRMPAAPLGHAASDARAAIENFSRRVIPAMVPVGLGLRRLLAQP
ncbi:hypothetical protein ACFQY5_01010 [Paeniroseomonas aquatica]|uniref:hypothetical protein n=1 Tax=Paeniroseomonas aquatica TaxID=373043 RepID=UPI003620111D